MGPPALGRLVALCGFSWEGPYSEVRPSLNGRAEGSWDLAQDPRRSWPSRNRP